MVASTPSYTSPAGVYYRGGGAFGKIPRAGASVSVRFQASSILRLVREIEGKFQPANGQFMRAVEQVNLKMAMTVQAGMVEELNRRVAATGRPQEKAGRGGKDAHKAGALAEALRDPQNRFANASGFIVGRPEYLNKSPARRYWRRIEEGGAAFPHKGWFFMAGTRGFALPQNREKYSNAKVRPYAPSGEWNRMHAVFPQDLDSAKAFEVMIGPFPAYRYSRGGAKALLAIDKEAWYTSALATAGITVTPRMVRSWWPAYVK